MDKKISYIARDFNDIKNELIELSKKYYPELNDNLNDAGIGAWIIDLMSAVGDDLSYHTDRMYQETDINMAQSRNAIFNNARMNGVKIQGPKSSICEVELSCVLPIGNNNGGKSISTPNYALAPIVKRGSTVGNSMYSFELMEDADFASQFNSHGYSNRKIEPIRNSNGIISGYKVTKTVMVRSGESKIYKRIISADELTPFMEIILPELDVMNVESILFKESANLDSDPSISEFYIDEEEFKLNKQDVTTYRYFEVNSLSDQYRFGTVLSEAGKIEHGITKDNALQSEYIDSDEVNVIDIEESIDGNPIRVSRYYEGEWKPITQKYITEYTNNGYLKIIFGCGTDVVEKPLTEDAYANNILSRVVNNKMLGLLPKAGWTMYVLYRVGGGAETNLAVGSINKTLNLNVSFKDVDNENQHGLIVNTFTVFNPSTSVAGKDFMGVDELRNYIKYTIPSQDRCVTLKDYKSKLLQIPPEFGCPFRCNICEENNKILIPMLGLNPLGQLDSALPQILVENIIKYLSHYKNLSDYIALSSGKVFNIGFDVNAFIDKNYVTSDVVRNIIEVIQDYMDINKHDMGEDIFLGDLERQITNIDGVISLINIRVYSITGSPAYSDDQCPLPAKLSNSECNKNMEKIINNKNGIKTEIDLDATDHVLYSDYNSMYEIKYPNDDINIKVKLK